MDKYIINSKKFDLLEYPWDILIVLDACRYDYFKDVYKDIIKNGKLSKLVTNATNTEEWLYKNFNNRDCTGIVYINPIVRFNEFLPMHNFEMVNTWEIEWSYKFGTILPESVTKIAQEKINEKLNKRFIIHYMQPHDPFFTSFMKKGFYMSQYSMITIRGKQVMKNKRIVVTGGAGFIGSNLTRALCEENQVTVVDDLSVGHIENIKDLIDMESIKFVKMSITDLEVLQKTFKNVDYVFHEAAIPSVPRSVEDPIKSNYANVNGTLNVLVAAKDKGVEKVVYASSSSVYGDTPTLPKHEGMKPCPLSPYAVSKLTGEYYCQVFTEVYGLKTVSLRYFNVYGSYQDPTSEYAAVIPRFISRVLDDKPPIIYGDGEQTRDFTFVKDVVNANILAAESKTTGVFNTAGGKCISINELAKLITKITGNDLNPVHEPSKPGDVMYSLADISKAKEKLNYKPKFNLKKGLEETLKWFQAQN